MAPDGYRNLVDSIRDYAILMLDPGGMILSWNPGAKATTGYSADEAIGSHFSRFYPADAIARGVPARALEVAAAAGRFEEDGWRVRKDGSRFWASVLITPTLDERHHLLGFAKVTRDFTERHRQEMALRESEERFRLLVSGVKDYAIFMLDPAGLVSTWNTGAEFIKGYTAKEIIGSHFSRFYPPEAIKQQLPETELRGAMMQGRFENEGWRLRKDGSRFWANVIITAVRNPTGQLIGFSKITRDLTERRGHEEELRQGEERFRLLVEGVTEYAIMMLDTEGFLSSWNAGAERIKGYRSEEVLGKHVSHFYPSEAVAANEPWAELNVARREGRVATEGWRVRKDGTLFWAASVVTALKDADGKLYGFAKVTQDLTLRRHAEALADTARRMHEFIAMLAHELRNPLAPIRNAVTLMGRKGLKDPLLESMRQTIDRQSVQLTRLLDELLDVNRIARGQFTIERQPVDFREVVARAVEASQPLIDSRHHRIELALPDRPLAVLGDSVRLIQVVVNLLNNAAKYTPERGLIQLGMIVHGAEIELKVKDNGRGIAPAMLEEVFDLFVQIDPASNSALGGLGVGLALVRRVVELHGGSIQARSEGQGQGAEFVVRLPLSIQPARVIAGADHEPQAATPSLRVLVVDDNKDAGDTLELLLLSMGQQVRNVYNGPSAITIAKSFEPDIVLLDIGMPEMNGYEVARAIRSSDPPIDAVLVALTGWGQDADRARSDEAGFQYHFVKPISESVLLALLTEVAAKRRQT
jgi:hypothetical protein